MSARIRAVRDEDSFAWGRDMGAKHVFPFWCLGFGMAPLVNWKIYLVWNRVCSPGYSGWGEALCWIITRKGGFTTTSAGRGLCSSYLDNFHTTDYAQTPEKRI